MSKKNKSLELEPKCALIMAPCPKTADVTSPLYCPNWVTNVPEVIKDGSGRVTAEVFYTGCQVPRQTLYQLGMMANSGQAAASADKAANQALECRETLQRLPLMVLSGEVQQQLEPMGPIEYKRIEATNDKNMG